MQRRKRTPTFANLEKVVQIIYKITGGKVGKHIIAVLVCDILDMQINANRPIKGERNYVWFAIPFSPLIVSPKEAYQTT